MRRMLFLTTLALFFSGASRLAAQDLAGTWKGSISVAGQNLPFTVHLRQDEEGAWNGKIDIQGAAGIALKDVSAEESKVHFELQAGPGLAVWDGKLEGESVKGTFTQSGIEGTFEMSRTESDQDESPAGGTGTANRTGRAEADAGNAAGDRPGPANSSSSGRAGDETSPEAGSATGSESGSGASSSAGSSDSTSDSEGGDAQSRPAPYDEEDLTLDAGDVKLACTYTRPHGDGPFPAAYLLTGSGPQERNETVAGFQVFRLLSDQLARHEVAVLRCDDRGVNGSTGDLNESAIPDFANDALAAVRHLASLPEVDASQVGLIGHSEGGTAAPLAASQSDDVKFIVMLAGTGVRGRELMIEQAARIRAAAGIEESDAEASRHIQELMLEAAVTDQGWEEVRQRLREALEKNWENIPQDQRRSIQDKEVFINNMIERQIQGTQTKWLRYFIAHDPVPSLEKLNRTPVLAIFGELDLQVPPDSNLPPIKAALQRAGNPNATFKVIAGANHLFQKAKAGSPSEYATLKKEFTGGLSPFIAGWIHGLP